MNDPYDMGEIPFEDATWMRGRKYNPASVRVSQAATRLVQAKAAVDQAYRDVETARTELAQALESVQAIRQEDK